MSAMWPTCSCSEEAILVRVTNNINPKKKIPIKFEMKSFIEQQNAYMSLAEWYHPSGNRYFCKNKMSWHAFNIQNLHHTWEKNATQ